MDASRTQHFGLLTGTEIGVYNIQVRHGDLFASLFLPDGVIYSTFCFSAAVVPDKNVNARFHINPLLNKMKSYFTFIILIIKHGNKKSRYRRYFPHFCTYSTIFCAVLRPFCTIEI